MIDQATSVSAMPISGTNVDTGRRCRVLSNMCATNARIAATNAMRRLLRMGNHSCGASSRMIVKATSDLNATSVSDTGSVTGAASALGRHQSWEMSNAGTSRLRLFFSAHADGTVEDLDVVEIVLAEPAEDFGVEILPLIPGRVPVKGIQPAPVGFALHRNRQRKLEQLADDRHAIQVIERNRGGRKRPHHRQRTPGRHLPDGIRRLVRYPVT